MSDEVVRKVLKWFKHVEHVSGEYLTKIVYESDVEGRWDKGRLCTRWLDGDRKAWNAS